MLPTAQKILHDGAYGIASNAGTALAAIATRQDKAALFEFLIPESPISVSMPQCVQPGGSTRLNASMDGPQRRFVVAAQDIRLSLEVVF